MMPIGDDNSDIRRVPYVTYILIAINVFVFVVLQGLGANDSFTLAWSTVPQEIVSGQDVVSEARTVTDEATGQRYRVSGLQETPISVYLTLLTSMFMHGSIAHIFGNMLYLWIFGDNVEDRLGHLRFLAFYGVTGALASLAHVASEVVLGGSLLTPSLGASGAISAILGAYLLLFPNRQVLVLIFSFVRQYVPAIVAVGLWFVLQLVQSLGMLGGGGGVAYAAHIGGFIAGVVLIKLFAIGTRPAYVR
jgi:membrane associated rhomboid family serine protease